MLTNNEKKSGNLAFILRQYRTDHDSAVTATSAHTISINMIAPWPSNWAASTRAAKVQIYNRNVIIQLVQIDWKIFVHFLMKSTKTISIVGNWGPKFNKRPDKESCKYVVFHISSWVYNRQYEYFAAWTNPALVSPIWNKYMPSPRG